MADATPLLPGLPDEISIWEILVRLPPKPLLRCRAVSPAWRRATSAPDFLLSHHARQPAMPLLYSHGSVADGVPSLGFVLFDHRAGVAAADRFQTVARLRNEKGSLFLDASCDGLLVVSIDTPGSPRKHLCICNPATRQYAPLHQLDGFRALGLYPHPSTTGDGEYRLLLHLRLDEDQGDIYVFTLGSGQPPREIEYPYPDELVDRPGLLFHGSIYWCEGDPILVFDTTAESFRQIRAPVDRYNAQLFEMDEMLGIFSLNDEETAVDIWVMQDYQGEVWDFKRRVALPLADMPILDDSYAVAAVLMVVHRDGELLLLFKCEGCLFQVDVDGKLIATLHPTSIIPTQYLLKQTLVQHTFFPALEGYVVNASPFI